MRLVEIRRVATIEREKDASERIVVLFVQDDGVHAQLTSPLPDTPPADWRQWAEQLIEAHLVECTYDQPFAVLWPDRSRPVTGKTGFESLPGWAAWTAQEAYDRIISDVTDLATAREYLAQMAKAIAHLRDVVVER